MRVSNDGMVLSDPPITIKPDSDRNDVSLAFGGDNYFVAYEDPVPMINNKIIGKRITESGIILDSIGITIKANKELYSTVFDGTDYLVLYGSGREISIVQVSTSGNVGNTFPVLSGTDSIENPVIAYGKNNISLIAYSQYIDSLSPKQLKLISFNSSPIKIVASHDLDLQQVIKYDPLIQSIIINTSTLKSFCNENDLVLRTYDSRGRVVRVIAQKLHAREQSKRILFTDAGAGKLPAGVYMLQACLGDYRCSMKLLLLN